MTADLEGKYGKFSLTYSGGDKNSLGDILSPLSGKEKFHCEVFLLNSKVDKESYQKLLNELHQKPGQIQFLEKHRNFSKDGDCIVVVEWLENEKTKTKKVKKKTHGTFSNIISLAQASNEIDSKEVVEESEGENDSVD